MPIVDTKDLSLEEIRALYEAEAKAHDKDIEEHQEAISKLNKDIEEKEASFQKKQKEDAELIANLRINKLKEGSTPKQEEEEEPKELTITDIAKALQSE